MILCVANDHAARLCQGLLSVRVHVRSKCMLVRPSSHGGQDDKESYTRMPVGDPDESLSMEPPGGSGVLSHDARHVQGSAVAEAQVHVHAGQEHGVLRGRSIDPLP